MARAIKGVFIMSVTSVSGIYHRAQALIAQVNGCYWYALALLLVAINAFAEESPTVEIEKKRPRQIEEVIVTATKRTREVRDIPTSIDAFTGEQLENRGATTIEEIVKQSPGVTLEGGLGRSSSTVQMRGITSVARGRAGRTIGRFYDNVPLVNPSIIGFEPDIDPFDMATIEILKGPQGTLFGGSALAGAVRFVPNKPDYDEFYGSASYAVGATASSDEDDKEYTLMMNVPLEGAIAVRLAGSIRDFGGYIDDVDREKEDMNDFRSEQWRAIVGWQPVDFLAMHINYTSIKGEQGMLDLLNDTGKFSREKRRNEHKFLDEFDLTESEIVGLDISWDLPPFSIVLESSKLEKNQFQFLEGAYLVGLEDTNVRVVQELIPETDQTTHEVRIVSNELSSGWWPFRNWEYTVGLFYMKSDQTTFTKSRFFSTSPLILNQLPPMFNEQLEQESEATIHDRAFALARETAVYFNLTRLFASRWELNLGGRLFKQVTDGRTISFVTSNNDLLANQSADVADPFVARPEESGFNPKVALTWQGSENIAVIASAAKGFRFGGVNLRGIETVTNVPPDFESDELINYELSLRTTWLDKSITADITAFRIDWDNMQIQQRDPETGIFTFTQNVGRSVVEGAEFGVNSILPWGFSISLKGAHVDSQTATGFESNQFGYIDSGTRLPQAPRWTGSASLEYSTQWFGWEVGGKFGYSYRGESKNNLANTYPLKAFGTYDMSLSAGNPTLLFEPRISLIATNLTDEVAQTFAFAEGPTRNAVVVQNTPRQVSLKMEVRF